MASAATGISSASPSSSSTRDGDRQLALAAVDEQQLRRVGELAGRVGDRPAPLGQVGGEAPGEHLLHGGEVVVALVALDLEAAVVGLLREPVLHHHHRADVVAALDVAHVVALDPQRGVGQPEVLLQLVERLGAAVVVGRPAQPVADELLAGVPGDRLLQLPLLAPQRHAHATFDPRIEVSHSS